ncbi:DUF503 domain-containing protein [Deferribacter autotrophicus]|uniref:DUF503 domain-containing protein n=1 Tax=Deferribacter autotrophicus TaxID=500465 RepID=A0A5A8F4P5_9BACT|nr:DUF503 domain-containing protein [Deferribacter autotrophicus]KAA0258065.1 DUF503 domain-containing protein [Deferribacter autotrophicus]
MRNSTFIIGAVLFELDIPGAFSLKDKRRVLNSLKSQMKNKFNVAVSEVGGKDVWNRSVLAVTTVSDNRRLVDEMLQKIINFVDNFPEINILKMYEEIL